MSPQMFFINKKGYSCDIWTSQLGGLLRVHCLDYIKINIGDFSQFLDGHDHNTRCEENIIPASIRLFRIYTGTKYFCINFFLVACQLLSEMDHSTYTEIN